jgi:GT2 family glycosyltransferase
MARTPHVDIIILNWNGLADTLQCLRSLKGLEYSAYRVVVVDNGSTDGSPVIIRKQFPEVILIKNSENLGFTGGNNVGIHKALEDGADYTLLLNNDTEVAADFLYLLVKASESNTRIGIAGPIIYYYEQPRTIWSAGGKLNSSGRSWMIGLDEYDTGQYGRDYRSVDFVTGCAMLVKNDVMNTVGILDDRFFAYYEETEWCTRVRKAGFMIVNVPNAKIWHKMPLDKRDSSPLVHYYMTRNRLLFLKASRAGARAWLNTLIAEYMRTLLSWSLRPKWRGKKLHRKMMILAIADAAKGNWGRCSHDQAN